MSKQRSSNGRINVGTLGKTAVVLLAGAILVASLLFLKDIREALWAYRNQHAAATNVHLTSQAGTSSSQSPDTPTDADGQELTVDLQSEVAPSGIKTIRRLPRSESDVALAHAQNVGESCEPLPPGQPLELSSFVPYLTDRDSRRRTNELPVPSSRRHIFSLGLDMSSQDQTQLPKLSGRTILNRLNSRYVSVQARVHRDPVSRVMYLAHRPLAATAEYRKVPLTMEFSESGAASLTEIRGLGLFLNSKESPAPENLRTLVLTYKSTWLPTTVIGSGRTKDRYEFIFVRARISKLGSSERLNLYTFATAEDRQQLHWLRECSGPTRPDTCSIKGTIVFTQYEQADLIPTASATRSMKLSSAATYTLDDLNRYARTQGWTGDALDNLTSTLDAVIDGKVTTTSTSSTRFP